MKMCQEAASTWLAGERDGRRVRRKRDRRESLAGIDDVREIAVLGIAARLPVRAAPQGACEVDRGENLGSEETGSPPSGASMIHSMLLPLNAAPVGGSSVIEKC
jgi:hypothetical protein